MKKRRITMDRSYPSGKKRLPPIKSSNVPKAKDTPSKRYHFEIEVDNPLSPAVPSENVYNVDAELSKPLTHCEVQSIITEKSWIVKTCLTAIISALATLFIVTVLGPWINAHYLNPSISHIDKSHGVAIVIPSWQEPFGKVDGTGVFYPNVFHPENSSYLQAVQFVNYGDDQIEIKKVFVTYFPQLYNLTPPGQRGIVHLNPVFYNREEKEAVPFKVLMPHSETTTYLKVENPNFVGGTDRDCVFEICANFISLDPYYEFKLNRSCTNLPIKWPD